MYYYRNPVLLFTFSHSFWLRFGRRIRCWVKTIELWAMTAWNCIFTIAKYARTCCFFRQINPVQSRKFHPVYNSINGILLTTMFYSTPYPSADILHTFYTHRISHSSKSEMLPVHARKAFARQHRKGPGM